MITPDKSYASTGSARTITMPLAMLGVEGTMPAEGDTVSVAVGGRIISAMGDEATLEIDSINGEPLPMTMSADEQADSGDQAVMDRAMAADKEGMMS